jgi:hypothetical protein
METVYCCVSAKMEDGKRVEETPQPAQNDEEEQSLPGDNREGYREGMSSFQKHNEKVKRFRLSHIFPYGRRERRRQKSEGDE